MSYLFGHMRWKEIKLTTKLLYLVIRFRPLAHWPTGKLNRSSTLKIERLHICDMKGYGAQLTSHFKGSTNVGICCVERFCASDHNARRKLRSRNRIPD